MTSSQVEQVEEAAGETAHLLAAIQWPPAAAADAGHLEQVGEAIQTAGIDYAGLPADLAAWSSAYTKLAGDLGGVQP